MIGKKKIDLVFVVLTPFHYKAFFSVYGDLINQDNVLILYEKYIDISSWGIMNAHFMLIPDEKFSVFELRKNFVETVRTYKQQIRNIKLFCNDIINEYDLDRSLTINIGSDRDVFIQVFLNTIYKQNRKRKFRLIAFEEGIGFYDKKNFFEVVKSVVYPILSPVLFGEKLKFNKPMGIDNRIDEVYCRFPDLIKKNGFSEYKKLSVRENSIEGNYNKESKKALVFSFPSTTIGIPEETKIKWISILYQKLKVEEFVIKLHPREDDFDLSLIDPDQNWTFLEGQHPLDRLNYFEYKYIVNFNSSVIMDLLASTYPSEKIITIGLYKKISIAPLYKNTTYLSIKDIMNEDKAGL